MEDDTSSTKSHKDRDRRKIELETRGHNGDDQNYCRVKRFSSINCTYEIRKTAIGLDHREKRWCYHPVLKQLFSVIVQRHCIAA